ncbi:hypothetical protein K435DRAFT_857951 [Dendrothele bispora CBS 962.96]|uniref:DNA 3'-5' helicase n=1 Tax=Dendrothele bispora (strain CBS 962.96) TaxID=1314807 RepID=A0A4S8M4C5_DENBC|nr:hypothetical protein K435DRAFT_857951 [Dendrothele bispora CBS 962.96]
MPPPISFLSNEGLQTLKTITRTNIPQWTEGLRPFQLQSIPLILENQDVFAITATGDGKSALFAVPILVHQELSKIPSFILNSMFLYAKIPSELLLLPQKDSQTTLKVRDGININKEIANCGYRVICVDPEHLREDSWYKICDSPKFHANVIYCCAEEAHVIDEWGLAFRPLFRHIGAFFRSRLPLTKSIFAITATMIPGPPLDSVCSSLGFSAPNFHLIRCSNECPNVEISVQLMSSALSGHVFPELLPYLNQGRKTIIHVRTIELGYRVFLYLFRITPHTYNRHHRIRMYSALAPDGYNQRTVELLQNDTRCQVVIATKAFSLGIHARTLQDSISIGTPDTQCELDQSGGRVGRDREMNAWRIIFVTSKEMKNAQKRIESTESTREKSMDLPKAQFLTEKTCRVSCINKIYGNPPTETSSSRTT